MSAPRHAHRHPKVVGRAAVVALSVLLLTGCRGTASGLGASGSTDPSRPTVVAAFYPLAYAAQRIGGDGVTVVSLTPPGVEPHDLELSATQVAQIAEADLVLYVPGFQPAVDEAVAQQAPDRALDVTEGLPLRAGPDGATDPHVWLDPTAMSAIGGAVASRLAEIPQANAASIAAGAQALSSDLAGLDAEYRAGLASCRVRDLVVSHEAFGYLADAYGMTQVGISGLSPDAEPSPARLREVADLVKRDGVGTVYYETLVSPSVAETLAAETGATAAALDPLEGLADGSTDDYLSVMRANLATLMQGQGCS